MKKILNNLLLLVLASTSALVVSCKDDDDKGSTNTDREFMTMFINDNNRGKGGDYPYNCGLDGAYPHGNTIHLYWYGVNNCAGYQIQMAIQNKVSGGASAWASVQGTSDLLLDTIVGPKQLDMLIKDLQYSTDYRFAIRALSTKDRNIKGDESTFAHASNWFGHGGGRQWQEYLGITTRDRYPTPFAIYVNQAETTETTMHIYLNKTAKEALGYADDATITDQDDIDKLESFYENFNIDEDGNLGYQILTVSPSPNNPNSTVGEKWKRYTITQEDRERGYIVVDGLTANSVYVIDVIDPRVPVAIDAKYNTCTARSDGQPGAPILLKHEELLATQATATLPSNEDYKRAEVFARAAEFNAAPLTPTLYDFISNTNFAEGQEYYLEGGKTYYLDGNDITCKGFVLRTDPADVAQGKRARVICGIGKSDMYSQATNGEQWNGCPYSMFTFGRSPEAGEGGEIYMKKLAFYDIDFDNPLCYNYGDNQAGLGTATGNYFFNMFSNGMAVTLDSLVMENCSFKRLVRGFIREQGPNYKVWNHVLIKNNLFYDCGYYNQGAGGYCWIAGINQPGSNLYKDFKVVENTFYDSPFPAFFSEENTNYARDNGPWMITFSNNTLINFNTRASGAIFKMRDLPNGSVYTVENNLFVLCKKDGDQRVLQMWGADIRNTQTMGDGSVGKVTLNFRNNWSTNNDLTNGSIFSANAWNTSSNSFQKLIKDGAATLNGTLEVQVADVSATELMEQPCPPHVAATANDPNMHRADALDGSATTQYNVNLYFKNTSNDIYNNNVGAARWRNK
ncbi:MAG: hypothetical protein K6G08_11265 [Prevotella sp.]|nr:hypothetical protein [Prevotella sp.]